MTQRPDRSSQDSFKLPDDNVIFHFLDINHIQITVPANTDDWYLPVHWYTGESSSSCNRVACLKGKLVVGYESPPLMYSGSMYLSPGSWYEFAPGDHHTFGSMANRGELQIFMATTALQTMLWRNICGVMLDSQLYPELSSTPYWVRLLYWMLQPLPVAQQYLTAKLLWIQIQMMRSAHNFYVDHGKVNVPLLWSYAHLWEPSAPTWTYKIKYWTLMAISKAVQGTCYWIGRIFLGMKAEYVQYGFRREEKSDTTLKDESAL